MALTDTATGLLDRERELRTLADLAGDLPPGGRVAVIAGQAGIGKSSLLAALVAHVRPQVRVLSARGGELERSHAFGIVRQLFRKPVLAAEPARRAALLTGAAALAGAALGLEGPAADAAGTLHGLYWLVAGLAAESPLLLVVDDAHWADDESLRFLHYLARRLDDVPAVLAIAHRVDEPGTSVELLGSYRDLPDVTVIDPGPLSSGAVDTLVELVLGDAPSPAFAQECATATGGNPFLLLELLRAARADGLLGRASDAAVIGQMTPGTISRSVTSRLARTSAPARRLAQAVAILGTDAHPAFAARLAELGADECRAAADELRAAGVLRDGEALEFIHPLVRTSVRDGIRPGARSTAHRAAAALLAEAGAPASEAAAHLQLIEPAADAWVVETLRKAALEAFREGAPATGAAHLERALREPVAAEHRGAVLRDTGQLLIAVDPHRAIEYLTLAAAAAEDADTAAAIRWTLAHARSYVQDLEGAVAELEQGAEIAVDVDLRRSLIAEAVTLRRRAGLDPERGLERLRSAVPSDDDDRSGARDIRTALALEALVNREHYSAIVPAAEVGILGEPDEPIRMLTTIAFLLLVWTDRIDLAYDIDTRTVGKMRAIGFLVNVVFALTNRSFAAARRGMLREAEADARAGWTLAQEQAPGVHSVLGMLVWALTEQGALDEAEAEWAAGTARDPAWPEYRDVFVVGRLTIVRARLSLAQDDAEQAAHCALKAGEIMRSRGFDHLAISAWQDVAVRALVALGRTDEAAAIAAEALRDAESLGTATALTIGLRLTALSTQDRARQIELLERAASHVDDVASPLEQAQTLVELGAALRRDQRRVDSREPLRRALDLAVRCNAVPIADRARAELRAAGARVRRTMLSGVESLTASELRVAQLAAEGLSNPEIAQRLYVTRSTVETHLSRCFMKLSLSSRAELAGVLTADQAKMVEPPR